MPSPSLVDLQHIRNMIRINVMHASQKYTHKRARKAAVLSLPGVIGQSISPCNYGIPAFAGMKSYKGFLMIAQ